MIREWWRRQMDARRAFSLALGAVSLPLCVLALAAAPGFGTAGAQGAGGFATCGVALGGASGIALRAFLLHRRPGTASGLRSAVVQGGAMAFLLLGMFIVASLIAPDIGREAAFGGDAWAAILAIAVVLGAASGVLWERNERRRRTAAVILLAAGLIIGGAMGLRIGGVASAVGLALLVVGLAALGGAILRGLDDLLQEIAGTTA